MLVLTRKPKQSICIDGEIAVTVLKIKGNTVQLGIQAPRHVNIVRSELISKLPEQAERLDRRCNRWICEQEADTLPRTDSALSSEQPTAMIQAV